ncbi:hypothetical protein [Pedobacter nototheniae]|uniref:hypothetical protein n=1 Tax=Pedobacter nototheniae TaxID=2488994 RepID=UPI00292F314D|nr:hypothetical protein [Pedobacter nototheniae]
MNNNLKNFSTGILAAAFGLVIVLTGSAFKTEKAKTGTYTFFYNGTTFDKASVENESNWVYDSNDETVCDDRAQSACTIQVDENFVNTPLTTPTLKSSTNLSASIHATLGTAFVTGSADSNMLIYNRSN